MMYLIMREKKWKLLTKTNIMSNKLSHTYQEDFKLGVYYTYDNKYNKIYDVKAMREEFKSLIKRLKKLEK